MKTEGFKTIGALTIGQTPRDDIIPESRAALGTRCVIVREGALDGLSEAEIHARGRWSSGGVILTKLRDGTQVRVRKGFVSQRLKGCVERLRGNTDLLLFLCTGDVTLTNPKCPVLYPGRLLQNVTKSLAVDRLGVVVPVSVRMRSKRLRRRRFARQVFVNAASPYGPSTREALLAGSDELCREKVDAVVMDCIGCTRQMMRTVRETLDRPVLSTSGLSARLAAELMDPDAPATVRSLSTGAVSDGQTEHTEYTH